MNIRVTSEASVAGVPLDLIDTFGPLSGIHAAMNKIGSGMPCGLIARFANRTIAEAETAIEIARRCFPVLQYRIEWIDERPMLVGAKRAQRQTHASDLSLMSDHGPLWRYQLIQDGKDAWMSAVWAHAAADGASMLRFAEAIGAHICGRLIPPVKPMPQRAVHRQPMSAWLARFLLEQQLRYLRPTDVAHAPGVAWLTIWREIGAPLLAETRARYGSFAAWLTAASCAAFCEQQKKPGGRVLVNLPVLRDGLERVGGFGFGIGSLLMPVKVSPSTPVPSLASRIARRLDVMRARRWDENFDRFIGRGPRRHHRFAALHASGYVAPILSISWKPSDWLIGGEDGMRDVACFAASPIAHISGHMDRNGISLSITSKQAPAAREELLRRIVARLGAGRPQRVLAFDGHGITHAKRAAARALAPAL